MTTPVRHRKHEIENAARQARELGLVVRLEADGSITFFPADHSAAEKPKVDRDEGIRL